MPTLIATLKVKEDKVEEAKTFLKQLAADTLAREPGTLAYAMHRRKGEPATFVVYEKYESDEAMAQHRENLKAVGPAFAAILAGRPEIVFLEEI